MFCGVNGCDEGSGGEQDDNDIVFRFFVFGMARLLGRCYVSVFCVGKGATQSVLDEWIGDVFHLEGVLTLDSVGG